MTIGTSNISATIPRRSPAAGRIGVCWLVLVLLLCWCGRALSAGATGKLTVIEHSLDDLLLCSLNIHALTLSEEVDCYTSPNGLLIPFGQFCQLLELGITVSPEAQTAGGFIISPERKFLLDIRARQVTIAGRTLPLDITRLEIHKNDLYVTRELLEAWLPLTLTIDTHALLIDVTSREPLPVQLRKQREQRGLQGMSSLERKDPGYPRLAAPYHLASWPGFDQSLSFAGISSGAAQQRIVSYSTVATADLGFMSAMGFFSGATNQGQPQSRVTFSRLDPDGQLGGVLHLHELSFGDVAMPAIPLLSSTDIENGFVLSSFPLDQQSAFATTTLQGTVLPNWDIELYRDEVLIAYQPVSADGRYLFRDVPLLYGYNVFRLVFYGPHGERREESRVFNVSESLAPVGQSYNRLVYTRSDTQVKKLIDQYEIGLTRALTLSSAIGQFQRNGQSEQVTQAGLRGNLGEISSHLDLARDNSGGWSGDVGCLTHLNDISVALEHTRADTAVSNLLSTDNNTFKSRSTINLDGIRLLPGLLRQPLSMGFAREDHTDGSDTTDVTARFSSVWRNLNCTNNFDYQQIHSGNLTTVNTYGTFFTNLRFHQTSFRGDIAYDITPALSLTQLSLSADTTLQNDKILSIGFTQQMNPQVSELIIDLSKPVGAFALGLTLSVSSNHAWSCGVNLFSSLAREPRTGVWQSDAHPLAQQGSTSVRVFLDENGNGRWDPGETVLPNVTVAVNEFGQEAVTDKHGIAFLRGLPVTRPVDLNLVTGTLEDPLWVPAQKGFRCYAHVGAPAIIDFPVVSTGEITGAIYRRQDGANIPAAHIKVQLIDRANAVQAEMRSEFDGYYTFSRIPAGAYILRVIPDPVTKPATAPSRTVVIPAKGGFLDGIDFVLEEK